MNHWLQDLLLDGCLYTAFQLPPTRHLTRDMLLGVETLVRQLQVRTKGQARPITRHSVLQQTVGLPETEIRHKMGMIFGFQPLIFQGIGHCTYDWFRVQLAKLLGLAWCFWLTIVPVSWDS